MKPRMARPEVIVRPWREEDIPAVIAAQRAAYPDYADDEQYGRRKFSLALAAFPDGQLLAEIDGHVVGYATSLIVQIDDEATYTYDELTGQGTFSSHNPAGDTLYGSDIGVDPKVQRMGIAQALWQGRRDILARYNLRRMLAYGRLLGFSDHVGRLTAREYVDAVIAGELYDRALTAHLRAGYKVIDLRLDLTTDPSSLDWATILELQNPDFRADLRQIAVSPLRRVARRMRVCSAQYMMRRLTTWAEFVSSVEFFVEVAVAYHCHFLVMPELFTLQLLTTMPEVAERDAMGRLADLHADYCGLFSELARSRGIYIVAGSTPVRRDRSNFNVAHMFTPPGAVHTHDNLHLTPWERDPWGFRPGKGLSVFDTSLGRVGMQICYDIEFPEPTRLLALAGAEVVFVPFSTDDRKAYLRVRYSGHARAVENNLYVVLSGNAGNLVLAGNNGNLLNYSRSAILTPSDFGFPTDGIAAEADPNVEAFVVADLDFGVLGQQRDLGSVRPLHDRRPDVYSIRPLVVRV